MEENAVNPVGKVIKAAPEKILCRLVTITGFPKKV